ncbi:MAG: class I SAM-dependent methyltransferase [Bacteroidetes bacterium]|nr:class I SAM-dependent methyltransferase [Bacteroidota bacterium]
MSDQSLHCLWCGSSDSEALFPFSDIFGDSWLLHRCRQCECRFLDPIPDAIQLSRAYGQDYYGEGEKKFEGIFEKVISGFRKRRAAKVSRIAGRKGRILDLGCGNGEFLLHIAQKGDFELHGIELDGNSARRTAQHSEISLQVKPLAKGDYPENHFGVITLFHVFEHLANPAETIGIISNILEKDGILVMSFPNIASLQAKWFKGNWLHLDPPRHLFFLPPKAFEKQMKQFGFEVKRRHWSSFEQNPFGFQQSLLNTISPKREILFECMKGNKDYLKDVSKFRLFIHRAFFYCSFPVFVVCDAIGSLFHSNASVLYVLQKSGEPQNISTS